MSARAERPRARAQRGLGAVALVAVLLLGAHLALLASHGAQFVEQRAGAARLQQVQAREAAESGLAWALAMLNDPRPVDARCAPPGPGLRSLRARWLAGTAAEQAALQPACERAAARWHCDCPDGGAGRPAAPQDGLLHPAFGLTLAPGDTPSQWRLRAEGCAGRGPGCGDPGGREPEARHRIEIVLARAGSTLRPPEAALTAVADVRLEGSVLLARTDPAGAGAAVRSGGRIDRIAPAQTLGPPGTPAEALCQAGDPRLAQGGAPALWRELLGLPPQGADLPGWERIDCAGLCDAQAVAARIAQGSQALWLDGDLDLGGRDWGRADQPVLLAVSGRLLARESFRADGLLIGAQVDLAPAGAGATPARLRGALVSLGAARLAGALELRHDRLLLARLAPLGGALVMVPGSWFDPVNP